MERLVIDRLKQIQKTLAEFNNYSVKNNLPNNDLSNSDLPNNGLRRRTYDYNRSDIHIYNTPYPYPYTSWFIPRQTVINNITNINNGLNRDKEKEEKKKEESDNTFIKVLAVGSLMVTSVAGTYIVAKDEYMTYTLSGLEQEIISLMEISNSDPFLHSKVLFFKEHFNNWINKYLNRVKPKFYSKISAIVATGVVCGSMYLGNNSGILGGLTGLTASGCYMLWKNLTVKQMTEQESYEHCLNELNNVINDLQNSVLETNKAKVELLLNEWTNEQINKNIYPILLDEANINAKRKELMDRLVYA